MVSMPLFIFTSLIKRIEFTTLCYCCCCCTTVPFLQNSPTTFHLHSPTYMCIFIADINLNSWIRPASSPFKIEERREKKKKKNLPKKQFSYYYVLLMCMHVYECAYYYAVTSSRVTKGFAK